MTMPLWISEAQALGTSAIALAGAAIASLTGFIAWLQFKTARQKLRLDLFPLRYRIYDNAHRAMIATLNDAVGVLHDKTTIAFHASLRQSRYLFDAKTFDYLSEIDARILRHKVRNNFLLTPGANLGIRHQAYLDRFLEDQQWLLNNVQELDEQVKPFLQIDDGLSFSRTRAPDLEPRTDEAITAFMNNLHPRATGLKGLSQRLARRIRRAVQRPFV